MEADDALTLALDEIKSFLLSGGESESVVAVTTRTSSRDTTRVVRDGSRGRMSLPSPGEERDDEYVPPSGEPGLKYDVDSADNVAMLTATSHGSPVSSGESSTTDPAPSTHDDPDGTAPSTCHDPTSCDGAVPSTHDDPDGTAPSTCHDPTSCDGAVPSTHDDQAVGTSDSDHAEPTDNSSTPDPSLLPTTEALLTLTHSVPFSDDSTRPTEALAVLDDPSQSPADTVPSPRHRAEFIPADEANAIQAENSVTHDSYVNVSAVEAVPFNARNSAGSNEGDHVAGDHFAENLENEGDVGRSPYVHKVVVLSYTLLALYVASRLFHYSYIAIYRKT